MGKILDLVYDKFSAKDFLILGKKLCDIGWIIEAGVHDGADTQVLLNTFTVKHYFGFEPDPSAFRIANSKLSGVLTNTVVIIPIALSDTKKQQKIIASTGFGLGISQISDDLSLEGYIVQSDLLDNFLGPMDDRGLLWLDVEGHTIKVLNGSKFSLRKFMICKIEVITHTIDVNKKSDAFLIHKIMQQDFILIRAPLQPSYFGDLVYLRKDLIPIKLWFTGKVVTVLFIFLHKFVYPILKIPK
jgi:FkbM family methyltransferase